MENIGQLRAILERLELNHEIKYLIEWFRNRKDSEMKDLLLRCDIITQEELTAAKAKMEVYSDLENILDVVRAEEKVMREKLKANVQ